MRARTKLWRSSTIRMDSIRSAPRACCPISCRISGERASDKLHEDRRFRTCCMYVQQLTSVGVRADSESAAKSSPIEGLPSSTTIAGRLGSDERLQAPQELNQTTQWYRVCAQAACFRTRQTLDVWRTASSRVRARKSSEPGKPARSASTAFASPYRRLWPTRLAATGVRGCPRRGP